MEASRRTRNGKMGGFLGASFKKTWTNISSIPLEEYLISALITITLSLEANSVLSPGIKGFSIVLRSLAIGFLGSRLYELGPMVGFGSIYHFFVVFCVAMGGVVCRYLKGIPTAKSQWCFAVLVTTTIGVLYFEMNQRKKKSKEMD